MHLFSITNDTTLCIIIKAGGNWVTTAQIKMATTSNAFAATTIVAFHIGRGGQFYNSGFKSFIGEEKIDKYVNDLFISYENIHEVSKTIGHRENLRDLLEQVLDNRGSNDLSAKIRFERITGLELGEEVYTDCNGSQVGLTVAEAITGIGCINIDNDYNTTYTCYLENCDEKELELIANYRGYVDSEIRAYAQEILNA